LAVAPVYGEESSAGAEIAVACEDGVVRLFTISPTLGISFKAACARQDARILSLAYHPTKPLISAGSADSCIRAYSTSTYRLVWRITVDTAVSTAPARRKSKRNGSASGADGEGLGGGTRQDTLVWALAYLPSGTLVAGDSLGVVSFWDDASATLIKALRAHHADVLCLAVGSNQDEPVVFSSGVDRRVLQFRLVENSAAAHIGYMQRVRDRRNQQQDSQSDKTWVLVGDRRFHSHDVRALVLCDEKPVDALVSAGVDSALIVTKSAVRQFSDTKQPQNKRPQLRVGMFPQRPIVSVAEGARLVLARFDSSVKLWRLGQAASLNELEDANVKDGERVGLTKKEKLVAEIKIKHSAKISRLRKFPSPGPIPGSTAILFTKDSKMLILAGSDCVVRVIDVSETSSDTSFGILGAFSEHAANTQNGLEIGTSNCRKENICTLAVSGDSQWLATGDLANRIYVFNLDNMKVWYIVC
ncbi:U3 small nucleolar RNA-associated protein, partial [Entophlyctis sp. JEL0112]